MTGNKECMPQYRVLAQKIRDGVVDGRFSGKLPPERELASDFGVSYMTARKAVSLLVEQGILIRRHGQGTFLASPERMLDLSSVGILLPTGAEAGAANPYYAEVIDGACKKAGECKLGMAVSDSLETLFDPDDITQRRMADGFIVCPNSCSARELEMLCGFHPVVLIEWDNMRNPAIVIDNAAAMEQMVEYLHGLGHCEIAYIGGPDIAGVQRAPARERKDGFLSGMEKCGLRPTMLHYGDFEFESGYKAARQILSQDTRPTAIVCANDLMALGAMRYAIEAGIGIPRELSITGFDDINTSKYVTPSLTTVSMPKHELGAAAVGFLNEFARSREYPQRRLVLPSKLVPRSSTARA